MQDGRRKDFEKEAQIGLIDGLFRASERGFSLSGAAKPARPHDIGTGPQLRALPRLAARGAGFLNLSPRVVREEEIALGHDGVTGEALLGEILIFAVRAESAGLGIVDETGVTPRARVLEADAVPGDVLHPPRDIRLDRGREIRVLLSNAWSMFCDQKCFMDAGAIKNTGAWLFPFFQAMHFSLALTITCPGRIFSLMSRASEGRGPVDFRPLEQRALGATPTWQSIFKNVWLRGRRDLASCEGFSARSER